MLKKSPPKKSIFFKKAFALFSGSILAGFGLSLAINAGYGSATLAVLWQGVSVITNLSIGTASMVVSVIMFIFVWYYDKKQLHIGTIVYQLVYGYSIDFFNQYRMYFNNPYLNLIVMLIGVLLLSVGTGVYASANMGKGAYDAVCFAISNRCNIPLFKIRILGDFVCAAGGYLLGGTIGLCTVATIVIAGKTIQKTWKIMQTFYN
ncbi:MAG: YitT family protein [Angelakisella sp.]|nr:YitT family protein [Angelakisella sp.]